MNKSQSKDFKEMLKQTEIPKDCNCLKCQKDKKILIDLLKIIHGRRSSINFVTIYKEDLSEFLKKYGGGEK